VEEGHALVPTFTAFAVINLLETHLEDLVDFEFTAKMEDGLDAIANGQRDPGPWLHDFYHGQPGAKKNGDHIADIGLKALIGSGWEAIDARAVCSVELGTERNRVSGCSPGWGATALRASRGLAISGRPSPTTFRRTS
jgi:DNA topoisomerase-1